MNCLIANRHRGRLEASEVDYQPVKHFDQLSIFHLILEYKKSYSDYLQSNSRCDRKNWVPETAAYHLHQLS